MLSKTAAVIYFAGLLQGLALVSFPAASSIFTNPQEFNLSGAEYGGLFIPQAILSIISSFLSTRLAQWKGLKFVFFAGLGANFFSMFLFALSAFFLKEPNAAYGILLLATASLGMGFGLTVPSLNSFVAMLFPHKTDSAVLILNALLGLGTALGPILVVIFIHFWVWWGLPSILALLLFSLLLFSFRLSLEAKTRNELSYKKTRIPKLFRLFAVFALLYGIVETINGNWASLYMNKNLHATAGLASLALSLFWAMATLGRIFFSATARFFSPRLTFCLLPFVLSLAFLMIGLLPPGEAILGALAFGLAGFGCSALLPLIISFGVQVFSKSGGVPPTSIAGNLVGLYLLGYGIAAFGTSSLQKWVGWTLPTIFAVGAITAAILGALSIVIVNKTARKG